MNNPTAAALAPHNQLVFGMGSEEYAIDIGLVQELRGYGPVTRLANAPDYVKGVINLRGVIVPLIDLRMRFGQPAPRYDATTVVIILVLAGRTTGIVVDSVADVMDLTPEQIRPAPAMAAGADNHVLAVASIEHRMLILLDIAAVLHPQPLAA